MGIAPEHCCVGLRAVKYHPSPRRFGGYPPTPPNRALHPHHTTSRNVDSMLQDGAHDAVIIDAEEVDLGDEAAAGPEGGTGSAGGPVRVELAIAGGPHKGAVVTITTTDAAITRRDPLDLLGLPATITVSDGQPALVIDG